MPTSNRMRAADLSCGTLRLVARILHALRADEDEQRRTVSQVYGRAQRLAAQQRVSSRVSSWQAWRRRLRPYGLITPLALWWGMIIGYPLVRAVIISLTNSSPLNPVTQFVGLSNYTSIFEGGSTTTAVEFTVVFALASTAVELLVGTALALMLARLNRFRWLRGVVMIPWAISEIVTATAGNWLFNAQFGMVDAIIHAVTGTRPVWLSDITLARLALIIMNSWEYFPLACLFVLTAVVNVPYELVEQARVDGASETKTYLHVHWSIVKPVLLGIATFVTAINIVAFALPYAMTQGAPGTSTLLVAYQVYELAIPGLQYGSGAALGVVILLMVLIVGGVGALLIRRAERRLT
jgi:ABC-type sugar transport system permease subunit